MAINPRGSSNPFKKLFGIYQDKLDLFRTILIKTASVSV